MNQKRCRVKNCKKLTSQKKLWGQTNNQIWIFKLGNRKKFFNKLPKSNNISTFLISPQWVSLPLWISNSSLLSSSSPTKTTWMTKQNNKFKKSNNQVIIVNQNFYSLMIFLSKGNFSFWKRFWFLIDMLIFICHIFWPHLSQSLEMCTLCWRFSSTVFISGTYTQRTPEDTSLNITKDK